MCDFLTERCLDRGMDIWVPELRSLIGAPTPTFFWALPIRMGDGNEHYAYKRVDEIRRYALEKLAEQEWLSKELVDQVVIRFFFGPYALWYVRWVCHEVLVLIMS